MFICARLNCSKGTDMGSALIFLAGLAVGITFSWLFLFLTKRIIPSKAGALILGLVSTLVIAYLAVQIGFRVAEHVVISQVVPQWKAQGHFDNGPSAFVAIGVLAMPFVTGTFIGGFIATIVVVSRRVQK